MSLPSLTGPVPAPVRGRRGGERGYFYLRAALMMPKWRIRRVNANQKQKNKTKQGWGGKGNRKTKVSREFSAERLLQIFFLPLDLKIFRSLPRVLLLGSCLGVQAAV